MHPEALKVHNEKQNKILRGEVVVSLQDIVDPKHWQRDDKLGER